MYNPLKLLNYYNGFKINFLKYTVSIECATKIQYTFKMFHGSSTGSHNLFLKFSEEGKKYLPAVY